MTDTSAVLCGCPTKLPLNIGTGEKLVGIEILDATAVLGIGKTPAVTLEGLEAAGSPLVVRDKPAKKYKASGEGVDVYESLPKCAGDLRAVPTYP